MMTRLYHGGAPGVRVGGLIEPGHARKHHPGCPWCEARAQGGAHLGLDGPSRHQDRVYATTSRLYAKHYASLYGRGDLYRVEVVGDVSRSLEDSFPTWAAASLRVIAVIDRAVLLTDRERRRLFREWTAADALAEVAQ